MASKGFAGSILQIDLTTKTVSAIDTSKYEEWGGGNGMGAALFWDLCEDKTVGGLDEGNVICLMASPLCGSNVPAASGRTEVVGIAPQAYPVEWFGRGNMGGRFSAMLKYAGWDGVVVLGKSETPVWVDVRDGDVQIRDADGVWGLDAYAAQEEIWRRVLGDDSGNWVSLGRKRDSGRTTQKPAVVTIGGAGESLSRTATLQHDAGNAVGQGGFGAVFGSKNLKAISVIGTGSVTIADPMELLRLRTWTHEYSIKGHWDSRVAELGSLYAAEPGSGGNGYGPAGTPSAPQGCTGCFRSCRRRVESGASNGSHCVDYLFYQSWDMAANGGVGTQTLFDATDYLQRSGINAYEVEAGFLWLTKLYQQGIVGPGKTIPSDLPFDTIGTTAFAKVYMDALINRTDIGADLAEGLARCAEKWGRYAEDTKTGILPLAYWGTPHHYDGRAEVEWGYGSILGERDINEHDFNILVYWSPSVAALYGIEPPISAKDLSEMMGEMLVPYCDPKMMDYSDEGIYSESMAKLVAWHRHYARYYKESLLYCDYGYGDFRNQYGPNERGLTGQAEHAFFNAVTGASMTFEDGMEIGRKIWNLNRAIWVIQGRHRDMEVLTDYHYEVGCVPGYTTYEAPYCVPGLHENGEWSYKSVAGRTLDRAKFEEWKSKYYALEGWDTATGYPTRATLEGLGLDYVADELEGRGLIGAA